MTVEDGKTATYILPEVYCISLDPCNYQVTSNLPKFVKISQDFKQLLIQPRDVSNQ